MRSFMILHYIYIYMSKARRMKYKMNGGRRELYTGFWWGNPNEITWQT